jgi:thioredoxin-related protein
VSKIKHNILAGAIVLACVCTCAIPARGEEAAWLTDFAAAKAKAKAEKKLLLVDFTGSDWCVWCKRLHNEVFDKEPFKADAPRQFVLVEIDLPQETKLPTELKAQNESLKKQYKISGFPAVLLMDAEGRVLAQTGYRPGGPEKYVENLARLLNLHESVVEMQTELAKTDGLDRARLLDRLIEATAELNAGGGDVEAWGKEIVALDAENKAGLKAKYDVRLLTAEVGGLTQGGKYDQALKVVEKLLAMPGLTDLQKHEACFAQGYIFYIRGNWPAGQAAMKKALAAAPKGPKVVKINSMIARMEAVAKDEEAALKLRAVLDKTEGPERLKLLDRTIAAYGKVGFRVQGKNELAAMQGWMQEVIRMDADNKAGLKSKYEYRIMSSDGSKLFAAHKITEARAVFEKALALPGITEDEITRALVMKCNCLLAQKDYQGVIDCAKKRAETAQGGSAVVLKLIVGQAERKLREEKDDTQQLAPKPVAAESGQDNSWLTDFAAAKTKAKAEKKLLLVDFTGTDWCPFCIVLRKTVFDKEPFKTEAPKQFVLVELDFPHEKKLPAEVKAQNDKLARQYRITGFPTVLLMDAEGQVLAQTGYRPGGPEKYVDNLARLLKLHDDVAQMQTELAKTEGLDRARLLDRLIEAATELGTDARKVQEWSNEVVALDPENKTGLKAKYDVTMLMNQVATLMKFGSNDQAAKMADKVLALPGLTDLQKHEAYFAKGFALSQKFDAAASLAALHKALEAAPNGPKVVAIKLAIQRMEKYTKDVENARQCLAELDKAEGPDRLKAMDRAIDALSHIGSRIDGKNLLPTEKEWMRDVIRLDADNKAGLKSKYEYRFLVWKAQEIYAAHKPADAQAIYEKALALPGISEDNITHATIMKCNCLLAQKDYQGVIDCAKKRAETVQGGSSVQLKLIVRQAEAKLRAENMSKGHSAAKPTTTTKVIPAE